MEAYARELIAALAPRRPELRLTAFVNREAERAGAALGRADPDCDRARARRRTAPSGSGASSPPAAAGLARGRRPAAQPRLDGARLGCVPAGLDDSRPPLPDRARGALRSPGARDAGARPALGAPRGPGDRGLARPCGTSSSTCSGSTPARSTWSRSGSAAAAARSRCPRTSCAERLDLGGRRVVLSVSAKRPHKNLARAARGVRADRGRGAAGARAARLPDGARARAARSVRRARGRRRTRASSAGSTPAELEGLYARRDVLRLPVAVRGVRPAGARGDEPRRAGGVLEHRPGRVGGRGRRRVAVRPATRRGRSPTPSSGCSATGRPPSGSREAGRARAAQFTWADTARGTLATYERALSGRSRRHEEAPWTGYARHEPQGQAGADLAAARTTRTGASSWTPRARGRRGLLDLGCGDGAFTTAVAERVAAGRTMGVRADRRARRAGAERWLEVTVGDLGERWPYDDGSVDVVPAREVVGGDDARSPPARARGPISRGKSSVTRQVLDDLVRAGTTSSWRPRRAGGWRGPRRSRRARRRASFGELLDELDARRTSGRRRTCAGDGHGRTPRRRTPGRAAGSRVRGHGLQDRAPVLVLRRLEVALAGSSSGCATVAALVRRRTRARARTRATVAGRCGRTRPPCVRRSSMPPSSACSIAAARSSGDGRRGDEPVDALLDELGRGVVIAPARRRSASRCAPPRSRPAIALAARGSTMQSRSPQGSTRPPRHRRSRARDTPCPRPSLTHLLEHGVPARDRRRRSRTRSVAVATAPHRSDRRDDGGDALLGDVAAREDHERLRLRWLGSARANRRTRPRAPRWPRRARRPLAGAPHAVARSRTRAAGRAGRAR